METQWALGLCSAGNLLLLTLSFLCCACALSFAQINIQKSFKKKKAFIYILIPFNSIFVKKAFKLRSKGSEGLDYGYLGKNISGREIVQGLQAETWLY